VSLKQFTVFAVLAYCLGLVGCAKLSPAVIQTSAKDYNIALQRLTDEQFLLNLVRLHYRDSPYFMQVTSLSSQFRLEESLNASANLRGSITDTLLSDSSTTDRSGALGASINFEERPTLSFGQFHGEEFMQRLLSRIDIDTILLLYHSGWNLERVFRLCLTSINGVVNASNASGPTPKAAPEYEKFLRLVNIIHRLQQRGFLDMGYITDAQKKKPIIFISPRAMDDPEVTEMRKTLGLNASLNEYPIVIGTSAPATAGSMITIDTRSLLGVMFFLSHAVQSPTRDRLSGIITVTKDKFGREFDWGRVTNNLFKVVVAVREPSDAVVHTRYRGTWFYIDDTDLDSKSTFTLFGQLFALIVGKPEATAPVLTLPIGK